MKETFMKKLSGGTALIYIHIITRRERKEEYSFVVNKYCLSMQTLNFNGKAFICVDDLKTKASIASLNLNANVPWNKSKT